LPKEEEWFSSLEIQQRDVKLFLLENPSIQYNPELLSVCVLFFISSLDPSRGA
jgi:hypothetical protein